MIIYVDEAGRGPLAGPVYTGLAARDGQYSMCDPAKDGGTVQGQETSDWREEVRDSKKLSEKKREELYSRIKADAGLLTVTARKSARHIDRHGIVRALRESVCEGLWKMLAECKTQSVTQPYYRGANEHKAKRYSKKRLLALLEEFGVQLVLDGKHDFGLGAYLEIRVETIIGGDDLVKEIGIASICAKVERDRYMIHQDKKHPKYGFAQHKGYGTQRHKDMIREHGVCELHRVGWCNNV